MEGASPHIFLHVLRLPQPLKLFFFLSLLFPVRFHKGARKETDVYHMSGTINFLSTVFCGYALSRIR